MTSIPRKPVTMRSLEGGFASKEVSFGIAVKTYHLHRTFVEALSSQFQLHMADGGIPKKFIPLMVAILDDLDWDWDAQFQDMEEIYFRRSSPMLSDSRGRKAPQAIYFDDLWDERFFTVVTLLLFKKKIFYPVNYTNEEWCTRFFTNDDVARWQRCSSNCAIFFPYSLKDMLLSEEELNSFNKYSRRDRKSSQVRNFM